MNAKINLDSIQDLLRTEDVEGLIAIHEAPVNEYDHEGKQLLEIIERISPSQLTTGTLCPILEGIWATSFNLDDNDLAMRRPALENIAMKIVQLTRDANER